MPSEHHGSDATDELEPYLERLRALPFVNEARRIGGRDEEYSIRIFTPHGKFDLTVELKRSHLSRDTVQAYLARRGKQVQTGLLAAPLVGASIAAELSLAGANFIDRDGNCFLDLDHRYLARVQLAARTLRAGSEAGLRAPAYQVLFALLAREDLMRATIRDLADVAGVSMTPARQLRGRLVEQGLAVEHEKGGFAWNPHRRRAAIELFVHGWSTTLRPRLFVGSFRTQDRDPEACERRVEEALGDDADWAFGGSAAALRIDQHYRGEKTIVHIAAPKPNLARSLRAIPDRAGPLVVLGSPGRLGLAGPSKHTAHPLLVYAELLSEGSERAREAAERIRSRWLENP
jgi:hypothetical protein